MQDYSQRINFTPELWFAAASKLRQKYLEQLDQARESFENDALDTPRIALELELARRLNDSDLAAQCEAEIRAANETAMERLMSEHLCQLRLAELEKLLTEEGSFTQAISTYFDRRAQIGSQQSGSAE